MNHCVLVDGSGSLTRAFANGNSQRNAFRELEVTHTKPSGDGVFVAGDGGAYAMKSLLLMPLADAMGAAFRVRVWGWYVFGGQPAATEGNSWIPIPLVELECVSGDRAGVYRPRQSETGMLLSTEFLAQTLTANRELAPGEFVVSGRLGRSGFAKINLMGCRLFELDFEFADEVSMNCLLAQQ